MRAENVRLHTNVNGYCPACGKQTLVLSVLSNLRCRNTACPDRNVAHTMLSRPSHHHVVRLTNAGYKIRHPLAERVDDQLFSCELDRYLSSCFTAPQAIGTYTVVAREKRAENQSERWEWIRA